MKVRYTVNDRQTLFKNDRFENSEINEIKTMSTGPGNTNKHDIQTQ